MQNVLPLRKKTDDGCKWMPDLSDYQKAVLGIGILEPDDDLDDYEPNPEWFETMRETLMDMTDGRWDISKSLARVAQPVERGKGAKWTT